MIDPRTLLERLPARPRTRFAPSPTGWLHLGHVVNAVWVWGVARAAGGTVVLRMEDHDTTRCRPEYEQGARDDLEWLGLVADEDVGRQTDAGERYAAALGRLLADGVVYACRCSRRDIADLAGAVMDRETPYPGTCRPLGLLPAPGLGLRMQMPDTVERFDDLLLGAREQRPAQQCGDLLIRDRLGNWTYQFAVVADDMAQEIDVVLRGADLVESTGRQISLARRLGRERPPVFAHHPLIRKPTGEKLSKAAGDTGLRELRAAGVPAAEVLREAAARSLLPPCLWPEAAR